MPKNWADIMDEEEGHANGHRPHGDDEDDDEEEEDVTGSKEPNDWDDLLANFPVPGELYVHLVGYANYYSALLHSNPPPCAGESPFLVNCWQQIPRSVHSPFRIQYGMANPALRGLVITSSTVVPNFGWTPRLTMDTQRLFKLAENMGRNLSALQPDIIVVPAVHAKVLRIFNDAESGEWFIASNERLELLPTIERDGGHVPCGPLGALFEACLGRYYARSLCQFTEELNAALCWFFGVYANRKSMLFLGTCRVVPHYEVQDDMTNNVDLQFSPHRHLPPAIPILPETIPAATLVRMERERLENVNLLQYADLYDGLLVLNRRTMFAMRLCYPSIAFLTPLLKHQEPVHEFIAMRIAQAYLAPTTDPSHLSMDLLSHDWYQSMASWVGTLFNSKHGDFIQQIHWQVLHIQGWLPHWIAHISSLSWEDWSVLDLDLQRLFVLLDYEHPSSWWRKILCNPKYTPWIAKAVLFCLQQWEQFDAERP